MRTMEWNDWETFCRVVEAGSFTAAAEALGIPKSTASAAVSRLEAALGVRLMTRTTRQLRLTEAGSHFYDDIAPLFERLREVHADTTAASETVAGTLRIAAPYEVGAQHLTEPVCRTLEKYPHLQIQVHISWEQPDLLASGYDIVFVMVDQVLPDSSLVARRVVLIPRGLYASPTLLAERTRPTARRIFEHLDRDLDTRTTRAFMDAWGTNTWPIEENVGRPQHDADVNALCSELGARYSEPAQLAQFLHDRLEDIGQANGSPDHGAARLFLARLLESNLPLARYLVQEHLRGKNSQLSPHTGCALSFLLMGAREEASALVDSMLATDDTHLQVVAEGYLFATNLAPYSDLDLRALRRIFASHEGPILRYTPHITHEVARNDKRLAIELITSVDVDCALRYARDFFMWIVHEDTIPFDMIHDDQLRRLVDGLRHATRLDEYWTNDFLKKAIRRVPDSVIELAKTRIEGAIASGDWGMQPLGGVLGRRDALDLLSLSEGREILRGLLDWARGRIGDYAFSYRFAELIEALCSPYDAACVAALEDWLAGGTDEHFKVITAIVREAGPRFVYSHEGFVARVLKAARGVGRTTHRDLSSAIFAASVSGARSGAPGQPFPFDLELKAMSEQRLALLAKSDPAFELYRELRDYAVREVERQLEEGRRMAEEDADT